MIWSRASFITVLYVTASSQTARTDEAISDNTAHLWFPFRSCSVTVWLWLQWLVIGGDAESMLKASKGSRHVSYVCTWPNYPTNGLSLLGLHFIITELLMISINELLMISINYSYYRYPQLHTKMCTWNAGALVQVMLSPFTRPSTAFCPSPSRPSIIASSPICIWGPGDQATCILHCK